MLFKSDVAHQSTPLLGQCELDGCFEGTDRADVAKWRRRRRGDTTRQTSNKPPLQIKRLVTADQRQGQPICRKAATRVIGFFLRAAVPAQPEEMLTQIARHTSHVARLTSHIHFTRHTTHIMRHTTPYPAKMIGKHTTWRGGRRGDKTRQKPTDKQNRRSRSNAW